MNHYQRLKVSPDAPAEVIRAAYRALAAKLHPDRLGGSVGPDDAIHAEMASLNAAYEVLIDPRLRQDYDATLSQGRPTLSLDEAEEGLGAEHAPGGSSRVDMDWLTPRPATGTSWWPPGPRTLMLGSVAILVLGGGLYLARGVLQDEVDKALSDQYAAAPQPHAGKELPPQVLPVRTTAEADKGDADKGDASATKPARRKPTVEELSRMSDEELLKALPALDGDGATADGQQVAAAGGDSKAATAAPVARKHMLDGKPLRLQIDTRFVEPLVSDPPTKTP